MYIWGSKSFQLKIRTVSSNFHRLPERSSLPVANNVIKPTSLPQLGQQGRAATPEFNPRAESLRQTSTEPNRTQLQAQCIQCADADSFRAGCCSRCSTLLSKDAHLYIQLTDWPLNIDTSLRHLLPRTACPHKGTIYSIPSAGTGYDYLVIQTEGSN